jgi:hypothetical protein
VAQRELDELAASDPATIALEKRLAALIRGEASKDNRERLQLADRAYEKGLYAASARLFAEAIEADPKVADDRQTQNCYNTACAAALAAAAKTTPTLPSPIKGEAKIKKYSSLVGEDIGAGAEKPLPTPIAPSRSTEPARGSKLSSRLGPNCSDRPTTPSHCRNPQTLATRHRPRGRPGRGRAGEIA